MVPVPASIVATVRNEKDSIVAFVDSLLEQSVKPAEIIIVDGASSDGTREILEGYSKRDEIVLISRDCNIAQGRNLGIGRASNSIIAVTDAGCIVTETWLKNILECFDQDPQPDVVAGNFRFICHSAFEEAVTLATFPPDRDETEAARYYPSSRSLAFKKPAWEIAKGYPEWLFVAEDTLFNIRLRQLGCHFVFAKDAIVRWRPRATWRALAKQRFNFARCNAQAGIGTHGYVINMKYHAAIAAPLALGLVSPWLMLLSLYPLSQHLRHNLLPQAQRAAQKSDRAGMKWYVVSVMEFVRLVGMAGFLLGRRDRIMDKKYSENQKAWMGVGSLDELKT
jgi:cellulose synthase/poly-beta-1,6-N-acetylglucosamine synthase-like glycosyltransferase